ncbi:hypothetical protein [Rhizorhabdus histidinilytica]|uniref:hypothetical protein n=1 Tax=Rhizorhabdus histidinilytica TaxID=439228 RepID=UPI00321FCC47
MTTDPTRAAEIVVEQRHRLAAIQYRQAYKDHDRGAAGSGFPDLSEAFARFERDHMQRPTDTARAGEVDALLIDANSYYSGYQIAEMKDADGVLPCECGTHPRLSGDNAQPDDGYRSMFCSGCGAHVTGWCRSAEEAIRTWNKKREAVLSQPATPSPVTDETALSGEAKARQLLAATINREISPGKAEHLLSGKDDLLFDARPALDAIIAALASTPQPASAETVERAVAAERERCAKIADWVSTACTESSNYDGLLPADVADVIADKIRQSAKGGE